MQFSVSFGTLCWLQGESATGTLHLEGAALCGMGSHKFSEDQMGQLSVESDYFITFQKTSPCHA
jgi:hypothetical protein